MGFSVGVIHIVQSLGSGDLQTGSLLRGILEDLEADGQCPVPFQCWLEVTKEAVLARLGRIADQVAANGLAPIVHLEMHGRPDGDGGHAAGQCGQRWKGLETASGELIGWSELVAPLTLINIRTCLNLVVVSQACGGFEIVKTLDPAARAVVRGFVGPCRTLSAGEVRWANAAFYRTLFSKGDVRLAVMAMNAAIPQGDSPFKQMRAEDLFRLAFQTYFAEQCTDEKLDERVSKTNALAESQSQPTVPPSLLRAAISDHRDVFDHFRRQFFFADLCPEALGRFPMTLEDCLPESGAHDTRRSEADRP